MKKKMSGSAHPPALRCRTLWEHALGGGMYKVTLRKAPPIVNGASTAAAKVTAAPSDMKIIKNLRHVPQDFQVVATIEAMEGCGTPCAIVTPRKGFEVKAEWSDAAGQAETATLSVGVKRAIHCKAKLTFDKRVCVVFDSATMATVASTATTDLPATLAVLREEPLCTLLFDGDADATGATAPESPGLLQEEARGEGSGVGSHGEAAGNAAGDAGGRSRAAATPVPSPTSSLSGDGDSNSAAALSFAPIIGSTTDLLIDAASSRNSARESLPGSAAAPHATPGGPGSQTRGGEEAAAEVNDGVAGAYETPPRVSRQKVEQGIGKGRGSGRPRGSKNKKTAPQPQRTVSPGVSVASRTTLGKSRSPRGRGLGEETGAEANAREETVSHQASRSAGGPSSRSAPSRAESDYSSNSGQVFPHEVSRQLPPAVRASSWGESNGLSGSSCTDEDANGRRAQPEQPELSRLRRRSEGDSGEVRGSKEKIWPESGTGPGPAPRTLTSDRATTVEQAPDNGGDANKAAGSPTLGEDTKADETRGGGKGITVPPGETWECARCTLLNDEKQVRCGACWTVRPREDYHLRRSRSAVPRFAEYQAARRIRQRKSAPARNSGPAGAKGGDGESSRDGVEEKTNGATESTSRCTAEGRRNKMVRDGSAEVASADWGDPLSGKQVLLMFVEWASTPAPPCTLDTRALAEQAAWEVEGAQPPGEECGAGSDSNSDRTAGTIPSRKRKITASRSVAEEGQGKRQRLPGNGGSEGGGIVEGTDAGEELSDTETDIEMDQAEGESSEMALSEALAKSSRDPPGQNGSGAVHPWPAAGCTATPKGEEYQGEGFLGPERDGNGEIDDRYRSADYGDGEGTEVEHDVSVSSMDY